MVGRKHEISPFRRGAESAFTLAELLVVAGIIALLIAITLPALQVARKQAMKASCGVHMQQLGLALQQGHTEFGYYPYADDNGYPIRYTWIDVLIQRRLLPGGSDSNTARGRGHMRAGYCPSDLGPDPLNAARYPELIYPPTRTQGGIDYSYGIGLPLATGGWNASAVPDETGRIRRFRDYERNVSNRVLAADSYASGLYNLSGSAIASGAWNDPTQYDNTVAWGRHSLNWTEPAAANVLFQDGHVHAPRYAAFQANPINTATVFVWQPGESVFVNPNDADPLHPGYYYPSVQPPSFSSHPAGNLFPDELHPQWYTANLRWTVVAK